MSHAEISTVLVLALLVVLAVMSTIAALGPRRTAFSLTDNKPRPDQRSTKEIRS